MMRQYIGLRWLVMATDIGFLAYWSVTAVVALQMLDVPASYLYRGYHDAALMAWNWSFAPLDIAASGLGLLALVQERSSKPWRGLALLSLAFTSVAGGMAIAFWAISGDFAMEWWAPNLFLFAWPWLYLPRLIGQAN